MKNETKDLTSKKSNKKTEKPKKIKSAKKLTELASPIIESIPLIYNRIANAFSEVKAIGRNQKNENQNFMFRGIDDIYNELHDILAKHTGQKIDRIAKDTDRDFFMSAEESKEYGIIDKVIFQK